MTDRYIKEARRMALERKEWGRVPARAIAQGYYDAGELVQRELEAVLKARPEIIDE